ncbi:MAG TPA: VC0807 family protein [Actinophytocola sp.]|jgi:hypothetical protein|nr:VC0807 family protein [Actinophytocola sp.]
MDISVDAADRSGEKKKYLLPVLAKIVIDVVIPIAGYYTLRSMGFAQVLALCLTSVPAVLYFLYRKSRGQRVDAFEVFLLVIIGVSNCATLLSANPRVFLSMDGWVSYGIALACFLSLSARRPLVYLLVKSLLDNTPLRVKHRTAEWDALWDRDPNFRRPWRVSTGVWGLLNVITGSIRLGIAFFAPVDLAPMLLGFMTLEIVVFTQVWQTWYLRRAFRKTGGFVPPDVPLPRAELVEEPSRPVAAPSPT